MNIFTNDDYRRIQAWLKANAIKDSDFAISENTVPDEDILVITQNMSTVPTNYRISIKNLLNSSLGKVVIDKIIAKAVTVNNVLTVDAANVVIDNDKGETLQDIIDWCDDIEASAKGWKIEYQDPQQDEPTVRAKYVLKDYKGVPKGNVIKVYKDSAITNVYLGTTEDTCNPNTGEVTKKPVHDNNEALSIVYRLDTGKYMLVNVPLGIFTREAEFDKYRGLGIEPNGQVFVKLASDVESTNYLHFNSLGEIAADGIEARILRDLGTLISSVAGDGTMWGQYKQEEGTREGSAPNDGSRWGQYKQAEADRNERLNNLENKIEEVKQETIYDVSARNNNAVFESLQALLSSSNLSTLIPTSVRHGGMTIRFIQGSVSNSDNKYVQYRLTADEWSTDTNDWAIADEGVYVENHDFIYVTTDAEDKILWAIKTDGTIYYGVGIPPQVQDTINRVVEDLQIDITSQVGDLDRIINEHLDGIETRIPQDYDNQEFIQVTIDDEGHIVEGIKPDGTKYIPKLESPNLNKTIKELQEYIATNDYGEQSDNSLFNGLVSFFECTSNFSSYYNTIQINFATRTSSGSYHNGFIMYNRSIDPETGKPVANWSTAKSIMSDAYFAVQEKAVAAFKGSLEGLLLTTGDYYLKFKNTFDDSLIGMNNPKSSITYNNLSYKGKSLDFLSPLVLAQDNADNALRSAIKDEKYREAILNPEHASEILSFNMNDEMSKRTFQMVRTDEIVVNDNLALSSGNQLGVVGFENTLSQVGRAYFTQVQLSTTKNVWDFSPIKAKVQESVTLGKRYIPRLFTACSANVTPQVTYTHATTKEYKNEAGVTVPVGTLVECRIDFPTWMADLMAADPNAQWVTTNPSEQKGVYYWILDYNVKAVRDAVIEGIRQFGEFLKNETVTLSNGSTIPLSSAILYIEFNPLGTWGEGQMTPLDFRCEADELLEVYSAFIQAAPDSVITTGGMISDSEKGIALTEKIHNLSNNVCRYGFTIEHLGAVDEQVCSGKYSKYAGKVFFSGEGAGWYKNTYWGGDCYLNTLEYLKRCQLSYARIQNWTFEDAALNPIKTVQDTAFKNKQMVAFIGYRFVLTPTYCEWRNKDTFRTHLVIANIGCSKCWWSFYETHIIVVNEDESIILDNISTLDVTKALPRSLADLGLYSLGNHNDINTSVDVDVSGITGSFKVYIKVVDKYGIAQPLYFSNYGRIKQGKLAGSYPISGYNAVLKQWNAAFFVKHSERPK